jgi:hypothetical protein
MRPTKCDAACNDGEIGAGHEAARALMGNRASAATRHHGDVRLCCFGARGLEHERSSIRDNRRCSLPWSRRLCRVALSTSRNSQ